jgi:hypothetical protein
MVYKLQDNVNGQFPKEIEPSQHWPETVVADLILNWVKSTSKTEGEFWQLIYT